MVKSLQMLTCTILNQSMGNEYHFGMTTPLY